MIQKKSFYLSGSADGADNGDVKGNHGMNDVWLLAMNTNGQLQW
jgi:hypothetical protein